MQLPWGRYMYMYMYTYIHVHCQYIIYMFNEKEERSKQGQTNNKAKQHSTPKAVTFTYMWVRVPPEAAHFF